MKVCGEALDKFTLPDTGAGEPFLTGKLHAEMLTEVALVDAPLLIEPEPSPVPENAAEADAVNVNESGVGIPVPLQVYNTVAVTSYSAPELNAEPEQAAVVETPPRGTGGVTE